MSKEYVFLKSLIGIDLTIAMPIFKEYIDIKKSQGYNKDIGGFSEELVAFVWDLKRPTNIKGADFGINGECKAVKGNYNGKKLDKNQKRNLIDLGINTEDCKTKLRNCGNPPISSIEKNINSLFKTNLWNKIKKVIFIYHIDNIIVDIRIFDGEKYKDVLDNDYNLIQNKKNLKQKY